MDTSGIHTRFTIDQGEKGKPNGKIKRMAQFGAIEKHNYRLVEVPHADKDRTHLNEELISPSGEADGNAMKNLFRKKIKESEYYDTHKVRSDAVLGFEISLGMGVNKDCKDALKVPDNLDINAWKKANVAWLKETFGEDNVASAVLHMDELTPHIHAVIIPIDDKGCLNAKQTIGGPQGVRALQESYEQAMEPFGFKKRLKRTRTQESKLQRWYSELEEATVQPDEWKPYEGESIDDYSDRVYDIFEATRLAALKEKQAIEKEMEDLKDQNKGLNQDLADYMHELQNLRDAFGMTMEENEKQKKKIRFFDEMSIGMTVFPDRDKIEELLADLKMVRDFGRQHIENIEMSQKDIDIAEYTSGVVKELTRDDDIEAEDSFDMGTEV